MHASSCCWAAAVQRNTLWQCLLNITLVGRVHVQLNEHLKHCKQAFVMEALQCYVYCLFHSKH